MGFFFFCWKGGGGGGGAMQSSLSNTRKLTTDLIFFEMLLNYSVGSRGVNVISYSISLICTS